MFYQQLKPVVMVAIGLAVVIRAGAIQPTELEPAEGMDAGRFELELKGEYEDATEGDETEIEGEFSYGINEHFRVGLSVPFVFEEEDDGIGDVGAFLEWVANPEADNGLLFGGELKLTAPTADDHDKIGGEAQLRMSKYFGERHGAHLTLKGYYEEVGEEEHGLFQDDETDQEFGYMAVVGYTFKPVESTTLIADVTFGEGADEEENTNLVELGFKHEFNETVELGVGIGAGLDDDSPDFVAHAGLEFKFGGHRRERPDSQGKTDSPREN